MARAARIEPVGVHEIAKYLDVERDTVGIWHRRTRKGLSIRLPFPPSRAVVSGREAWDWPEVRDWYIRFKRLPDIRIREIDERVRQVQIERLAA